MRIPAPKPGLVIRYSFLWSHEHERGSSEGCKDRPCVIILLEMSGAAARDRVSVLPITHLPPGGKKGSHLKLTPDECRSIGLDGEDHWVVLDEVNRFVWPGYDLRMISGTDRCEYGRLSQNSFARIVDAFKAFDAALKSSGKAGVRAIGRDD